MPKSPFTGQIIELPVVPVRDVLITQPFAVNYASFYLSMGLKGHNGIDFRAMNGCPVLAAHSGVVTWAGKDGDGGISVNITKSNSGLSFYTLYYHLKEVNVEVGNIVKAGNIIGWANNTGKYTTGDHLHFGIKEISNGATINKGNGYNGAIDPAPYLPRDWDKSNAEKRYGRKRDLANELKVMLALLRYLKRKPSYEQINACVYGAWDREAVANPAMRQNYAYLTKGEFLGGKRPFC